MRKDRRQRFGHDIGEFIVGDFVPDVEEETATRLKNAAGFPVGRNLVREKHGAELAGDDIERFILKRQGERIGLPPGDSIGLRLLRCGMIQHRLVEIGRHDAGVRGKPRCDGSRQDAGPGSRLQQIRWLTRAIRSDRSRA